MSKLSVSTLQGFSTQRRFRAWRRTKYLLSSDFVVLRRYSLGCDEIERPEILTGHKSIVLLTSSTFSQMVPRACRWYTAIIPEYMCFIELRSITGTLYLHLMTLQLKYFVIASFEIEQNLVFGKCDTLQFSEIKLIKNCFIVAVCIHFIW